MYERKKQIQIIVDEIDRYIKCYNDEALSLRALSCRLGYSEYYTSRKFEEMSSIRFKNYLQFRKLAFALEEVRDSQKNLLEVAFNYGFSSHEAFTRAFKGTYGVTPSEHRKNPKPVVLRTEISAFDRYFLGLGEIGMIQSADGIRIYFITIPAHKFLYIKSRENNGYWDFWQRRNLIPGQDYETVCDLLDSIKGRLDDGGGSKVNCESGQIMAYMNNPDGKLCDWGVLRSECWGVRLPPEYKGAVPPQMLTDDIPEAECIVFEHGPFDYEQENRSVEERIENAMAAFDYADTGCCLDTSPGRPMYFYYSPEQYFKCTRPVQRVRAGTRYNPGRKRSIYRLL